MNKYKYCKSLTRYSRHKTNEFSIGNKKIGDKNPIRIQSMTNTNTSDINATLIQCIRLIETGCEYVRITTPSVSSVSHIKQIKKLLSEKGYNTPIIADVHFNPKVAELLAPVVDKIRINPGNYVDKKNSKNIDYTDEQYLKEANKIKIRLIPLLNLCKQYNTAIRIGTNHGSLSDRIMSKYGDTPLGMVESTLEFLRICKDQNFNNVVISLKSSNTRVMVFAYRLMVNKMILENMNYPLHLGVTEAGDGEDGRIKSAVGIGTLLADGIGDSIRVSLTEEPEKEIPVAEKIVKYFANRDIHNKIIDTNHYLNPFEYNKNKTDSILNIGGKNKPVVIHSLLDYKNISDNENQIPDYFYIENEITSNIEAQFIQNIGNWENKKNTYPLFEIDEYLVTKIISDKLNFVKLKYTDISKIDKEICDRKTVFVLNSENINKVAEQRAFFYFLNKENIKNPVIIFNNYNESDIEQFQIKSACDTGSLLIDGFSDGLWLSNGKKISESIINSTSFGILQASRVRVSKTEYISCPSCGRTLFDLQKTTAKIKEKTSHLTGLKIGIMGCIVNGPGEMADADYGYVGTGTGKITLYKNKDVIKKNIQENSALTDLVNLIKENGDWFEPNK